jgi:hypothetical protein
MHWLGIVLLLLPQSARPAPPQDMPADAGVYYRQDDGGWTKLNPARIGEVNAEGVELFIDTGGYTSLGMKGVLNAARASLRISTPRPVFYVRRVGIPEDAFLIQLKREKNRRVFKTSSADAAIDNKGGFSKKDIRKTAVVAYSDFSFSVTPERALKPGEYLLLFGYATAGYDFGIDAAEKR